MQQINSLFANFITKSGNFYNFLTHSKSCAKLCIYIIFVCTTLLLLYSILAYIFYGDLNKNTKSLNLLNHAPQEIFGNFSFNKNTKTLELSVDDIGVALILFSTPSFNTQEFSQLELSIENLPYNYQIKLVVAYQGTNQTTEMLLLQPNGSLQINLLNKNIDWNRNIEKIGLRILPHNNLGLFIPAENLIKIHSAALVNKGYWDNYFTLFNYWRNYEPWEYLSISHFKIAPQVPMYAQLQVFVGAWLIICILLAKLIYRRTNSLILVLLAWLILDVLFINNMLKNQTWVDAVYSTEDKILPDDELVNASNTIMTLLKNNLAGDDKPLANKIFILTDDKYTGIRLTYHLLPLNVGFLNILLPITAVKSGDYILSYARDGSVVRPKDGVFTNNGQNIKVAELASDENYIFMQVLN